MRRPGKLNNEVLLREIVPRHTSTAGILKELGLKYTGGNHKVFHQYIKKFGISIEHFKGTNWRKGVKGGYPQKKLEDVLSGKLVMRTSWLKKRLIQEGILEEKCYICNIRDWMGEPLQFHLHHKDGNHENCAKENLELHCPNCHSQTDTYAKKKGSVDQRQSQGT